MKQILLILCSSMFIAALAGCNGAQSEAAKQAELIKETAKTNSPGTIPTAANSYYMTAKIDGKEWAATEMTPDDNASSNYKRIAGANDGDNIDFQLWKRNIEVGKKIPFTEDHAANLTLKGVDAFFGGRSGEIEFTKMDDKWLEGTFHFTATSQSSDKKIEVTDGRFRIALVPGLQ